METYRLNDLTKLRPGDLIGTNDRSLVSAGINLGSLGIPGVGISHVAICGNLEDGTLAVFESTSLANEPCLIQKKRVSGVQAHRPADILKRADRVYHYPLHRKLYTHERRRLNLRLDADIGKPYDMIGAFRSGGVLFAAINAFLGGNGTSELFCSEWVAAVLSDVGIFPTTYAARYSPNKLTRRMRWRGLLKPREKLEVTR